MTLAELRLVKRLFLMEQRLTRALKEIKRALRDVHPLTAKLLGKLLDEAHRAAESKLRSSGRGENS
jgi:hypothetical protein